MLELTDVHAYYGHIHALKGVSLEVRSGEIVAMIGANGAGKSTTLMSVSGVVPAQSGSIRFLGTEIACTAPEAIVGLGCVQCPEGRRIFGPLTVMENSHLGAYCRRERREVRRDLKMCLGVFPVLKERRRQKAGTLSEGEQQMLAIARSLMARPKLLLLDEPSLGLAPVPVTQIFQKLRQIQEEGITILLVEQNARQALEIADRGYVLESGGVTMGARADQLREDPRTLDFYLGGP